jgi:predicted acylesterase/phospholipase RssA
MRVLSIDGGGFLGLATASFVAGIEAHTKARFHDAFDLFCGTSTGAIIALGLAHGLSGQDLVDLYRRLGPTVFRRRTGLGLFAPKYRNEALARALEDTFGDRTLTDLLTAGKRALITAFCVSSGTPRIFKTDHSPRLTLHGKYRLRDIALASAAAPIFFPLVELTNPESQVTEVFCDGGVVANHPALLGFAEAVHEVAAPASHVSILSLSTPREHLGEQIPSHKLKRGLFQWRRTLASVLIDSNSVAAHEVLRRIVASYSPSAPIYERIALQNPHALALDDASPAAIQTLTQAGAQEASLVAVRERLRRFLPGS